MTSTVSKKNRLVLSVSVSAIPLSFCMMANGAMAQDGNYIPDGYSIETVETPDGVPFHATGLDINPDGDVAVATRLGDVWIMRGGKGDWTQFAEGLSEPTGLAWEADGSILVTHKPELTRLVDTNGDGRADEYVNLADEWTFHDNYHEYNFGPVRDKDGNLIGTLNLGHGTPNGYSWGDRPVMVSSGGYRGWAYKVTPDGKFTPIASGLRSPAGVGVSPDGIVYYTDNQGDWVPTSKLHILKEGAFYGHPASLRDEEGYSIDKINDMSIEDFAEMSEQPVVWIPHQEVANSPGNPEWNTTGGNFGPFEGQIFVGDQTQSNIFRILLDTVNGVDQGAVINFADNFQSGNIRLAFAPDGALWVGQTARGWGAKGPEPYGLQKLVWDGETQPFELHDIKMTEVGFDLTFTEAVDADSVSPSAFNVEEWGYLYSDAYGSEKMNLKTVPVSKATLSDDGKGVSIAIDRTPEKVMAIDFDGLRSASDREVTVSKVYYTVNTVLGESAQPEQHTSVQQEPGPVFEPGTDFVIGYNDGPLLPGGKWKVHDPDRPRPKVVTPKQGVYMPPPSDAVVLFDGTDLSEWRVINEGAPDWLVVDGAMRVPSHIPDRVGADIRTKKEFGDAQLHIEWRAPSEVVSGSQGRGNSGVFLMGLYEVQVLDSYQNKTYADGQASSLYGFNPPLNNAMLPPGEWQSYDIVFEAPKFAEDGELISPAYATVFHNGIITQNRQPFFGLSGHRDITPYQKHAEKGPIKLQDHGNPVEFRNIWIRPLDLSDRHSAPVPGK